MTLQGGRLDEDTAELLFGLASVDRLTLLTAISERKERLTALSKLINASAQECSRHLARLSGSGLITKDSEGLYEMTTLGKALLKLITGMRFLLTHKDYFLSHDLTFLPEAFVERIGELSGGTRVNHVSSVLELIKSTISGGREYVWLISDQPIVVGGPVGTGFFSRDVPVRLIGEKGANHKILEETRSALRKAEVITLPEVRIAMAINESSAGICFPGPNGKIDFGAGFVGKSEEFRGWCTDLFGYYWSKGPKPL